MDPQSYPNSDHATLSASQYLQDRLHDRRARNMRPKRARQTDFGPRRGLDDDIFVHEAEESQCAGARRYDSSPMTGVARQMSAAATRGNSGRASLSVRDVDEQMDRLSKQNFALKLELDHRRDLTAKLQSQIEAMQARIERVEVLEEEHTELLRINTQLVEELERRDKAVEEAVDTICDLEEKVADMEERHSHTTRPSTAKTDSGYAGTETHEQAPPSSPPEIKLAKPPTVAVHAPSPATAAASQKLQSMIQATPAKARREPSFMSLKKPSTHALRSVYMETSHNLLPVKSFNSLLSRRDGRTEDGNLDDILNSPRLSVLSESSFPSLYSPKKQISPEKYAWEAVEDESLEDNFSYPRQDSIKRVSQWMEEHDVLEDTPSKSNRISSPMSAHTDRTATPSAGQPIVANEPSYQSLTDVLSPTSTAQRIPNEHFQSASRLQSRQLHRTKRQANGTIYSDPLLPPTPDSVSTHMLRASRSSITGDQSLLDTTPGAVKGFAPLEPGVRTAPKQFRSSIELNGAYLDYQQYRKGRHLHQASPSSSDDEEDGVDARSQTVKDLSLDYDAFPDGNSIIMGTPSRFLKHGRPAEAPTLFDPNTVSPTQERKPSAPKRRQSSTETGLNPPKPSMTRAETSPTFLGTLGRIMTNTSRSTIDSVTSPRSLTSGSGSSGNRTIVQNDRDTTFRPESCSTSRTSSSPARRLSQRTQKLFRRMSNSHAPEISNRPEPQSPTEKSPLPTLTSTPSSAYVNTGPRRPITSEMRAGSSTSAVYRACAPGGGAGGEGKRRPSLQARTWTEPATSSAGRPGSAAAASGSGGGGSGFAEQGIRSPFRRTNSVQKGGESRSIVNASGVQNVEVQDVRAGKGGLSRRRGSIREAVAGERRPWR
ncbi:hypothetical protein LTR78_004273 [Recurvomyces mirabilis]|uniref:Centrosomin N-terminal motif 1 domain-containing protein n=1 Tax=Recurvomyces mirabilis TaxID=574656 RepID=A0AAE0WQP5_9PEZI|nr:hypothetical protein LTR78_004273 [Recurvomyces mirabilis]KAK5153556.1 hypothetical protein LTS14_007250 [Recurvomyces mirabilis]